MLVKIFSQAVFEECKVYNAVNLGNTVPCAEIMDGGRRVASSPETAESRHSGVIPAVNDACFDHGTELSLGKNCVGDAKPCELDLTGLALNGDVFDYPVVKRSVCLEFK